MTSLVRLARRGGSLLLAAAIAATALPQAARAHCAAPAGDQPAHHQHQAPDVPAPTGDCPHCPPAQCASQTHCAAAVDVAVAQGTGPRPVSGAPPVPARVQRAWASHAPQPIPPPPQLRV